MRLLPKNEELLNSRFPHVFRRIIAVQNDLPNFDLSKKGAKFELSLKKEGHDIFPYGKGNEAPLIQRWLKMIRVEPNNLYSITGFGLGHHVRAMLKKISPEHMVFVAEPNPRLLLEVFSQVDCSDILEDERFLLGTGEVDDDFFHPLQEAALMGVRNLLPTIYSPLHCIDEAYYDKFFADVVRKYLFLRPLYMANMDTAAVNQENTLDNIRLLANAPDVGVTEGVFSDMPLILVGAGPSLEESLDFLRAAKDHAIIACSNTPYRTLMNAGIKPHVTISADPKEYTGKTYESIPAEDVMLLAPMSACPSVHEKFAGRAFSWSGISPIANGLRQKLGLTPGTAIVEQGTVSACILDIARFWGCPKIIFVGQDMAMTESGQYYVKDSIYADEGRMIEDTSGAHMLPGNTVDRVPVESRLFVYLKTFEQYIEKYPDIDYVNTARLGVKVEGARYQNYEQVLEDLKDAPSSDCVYERLEKFLDEKKWDTEEEKDQAIKDSLKPTLKYAKRVFETSLEAALKMDMLPEKLSNMNYSNHSLVKEGLAHSNIVNQLLDSDKENYDILFEGSTKLELIKYKRKLRTINHSNKNWEALMRNKEYYWGLVEGSNATIQLLESRFDFSEN